MKNYKLTDDTIEVIINGKRVTLHRIECTVDISSKGVKVGDKGGFIQSEHNLAGNAWVYDNAEVYGNAWVYGNAKVYGNAEVYDNAKVYGNAEVYDNAKVYGNADYIVFKNWWSSGRYFTWTRSNNMWKVGCFFGTGEELIEKAYKDSEVSGREYERVVKYVESILNGKEE